MPESLPLSREDVTSIATAAAAAAIRGHDPRRAAAADADRARREWLASVEPFPEAVALGCRALDEYEFKPNTLRVRDGGDASREHGGYSVLLGVTADGKRRVLVGPAPIPVSVSLRTAARWVSRLQGPHAERIVATRAALEKRYAAERAKFARGERPHAPAPLDWSGEPAAKPVDPKHAW